LNYLTRHGAVSHRPLPPSPSFAFGTRERARGTGEFCLPPNLAIRFQRSRVNQPDPTFPQSPGIIHEANTFNLSTVLACFVLSMNCQNHNSNRQTDNELICTGCSLENTREQRANNSNQPMKSSCSSKSMGNYSPHFHWKFPRCEEVFVSKNKNRA
jgi:hypothetical protein